MWEGWRQMCREGDPVNPASLQTEARNANCCSQGYANSGSCCSRKTMLPNLSTGSSAVNSLSKSLILLFFFCTTGVKDPSVNWVPNLWQLKFGQALLNTEHRDHTTGVCSPQNTLWCWQHQPRLLPCSPDPGRLLGSCSAGYQDTEGEQQLHCPAAHMPLPNSADTVQNLSSAEGAPENAVCLLPCQPPAGRSTVPQGSTAHCAIVTVLSWPGTLKPSWSQSRSQHSQGKRRQWGWGAVRKWETMERKWFQE